MATPKTQGFALSTLPRAPNIPNNVGVIDMKSVVDGVRQSLAALENVRRAPASMLLADAEMEAKTAEAPLGTRQVLAQTDGIEQQTPLKTAILASEASPEMQDAKRQALLNRSLKQPAGAIQIAQALANARLRLAEDPTDAGAAQLVAALERIAPNPQGAIEAGLKKTEDTNAARLKATTMTTEAQRDIAALNDDRLRELAASADETRRALAANELANRAALAKDRLSQSETNARIAGDSRINAAKSANVNKAYQIAAEQNQQIQSSLGSLALLEGKADQYLASSLGSGPIVGSAPALLARAMFGDTTGQELKAAIGQEMTNAVKTVQGLGAMSNIEFGAVMEQLPKTTDQGPALITKLEYLKAIRPWLAARSNLYLTELEKHNSPVTAYQKVRMAFPLPPVVGDSPLSSSPTAETTPTTRTTGVKSFATEAEADAAGARGEVKAGEKITVGGQPGTWQPR